MPPSSRRSAKSIASACVAVAAVLGAVLASLATGARAAEPAKAAPEGSAKAAPENASAKAGEVLDPMQRLRQRLAERLPGGGIEAASGSYDLKVATRAVTPARHRTGPSTAAAAGAAVAATAAVASPAAPTKASTRSTAATPSWGYEGAGGPSAWGSLKPEFALCAKGLRQSPIDLRDGLAVDLEPVRFDYRPGAFSVLDDAHTVRVLVAPGNAIEVGTRRYELQQFHFHHPAEERIDGRTFDMSAHLVHRDAQGRLAVVALLFERGAAHPAVQQVWNHLPLEKHEENPARIELDPAALLPAERGYYTYMGSTTTPPCSEGVQWIVMRTPVTLSAAQVELFARIHPMNARPLQSAAGRRILQSQ